MIETEKKKSKSIKKKQFSEFISHGKVKQNMPQYKFYLTKQIYLPTQHNKTTINLKKKTNSNQKFYSQTSLLKDLFTTVNQENLKLKKKLVNQQKYYNNTTQDINNTFQQQYQRDNEESRQQLVKKYSSNKSGTSTFNNNKNIMISLKKTLKDHKQQKGYLKIESKRIKKIQILQEINILRSKYHTLEKKYQETRNENQKLQQIILNLRTNAMEQNQAIKSLRIQILEQQDEISKINAKRNQQKSQFQETIKKQKYNQEIIAQELMQVNKKFTMIMAQLQQIKNKQIQQQQQIIKNNNNKTGRNLPSPVNRKFKLKFSNKNQVINLTKTNKQATEDQLKTCNPDLHDHTIQKCKNKILINQEFSVIKQIDSNQDNHKDNNKQVISINLQQIENLQLDTTLKQQKSNNNKYTQETQTSKKSISISVSSSKTPQINSSDNTIDEIIQLIAYRVKMQKISFEMVINQNFGEKQSFTCLEIQNILSSRPFLLNSVQVDLVTMFIFDQNIQNINNTITAESFKNKLQYLIKDFTFLDQNQQRLMYFQIAEMLNTYKRQFLELFKIYRNQYTKVESIDISYLILIFKKIQVSDSYIQLIIGELCLVSPDLNHLLYLEVFQRFTICIQEQC